MSTPATLEAVGLVERDRELSVLRDALSAARQGAGRLIVIEGPPGIGKSLLLVAVLDLAATAGLRRLRAGGEPLEQRFAYGLVRQLLAPVLSEGWREFSGAEREAAR